MARRRQRCRLTGARQRTARLAPQRRDRRVGVRGRERVARMAVCGKRNTVRGKCRTRHRRSGRRYSLSAAQFARAIKLPCCLGNRRHRPKTAFQASIAAAVALLFCPASRLMPAEQRFAICHTSCAICRSNASLNHTLLILHQTFTPWPIFCKTPPHLCHANRNKVGEEV